VALRNWRQLCDRGPDLVLCLDFPGGRAAGGFAELAAGSPVDSCFLHIGQSAAVDSLDVAVGDWVREALETGRPVRAVLGYCAGAALATCVADAIASAVPSQPPEVVLFDAVSVSGAALCDQFVSAVESSSEHLTADELDSARRWSAELLDAHPDDLPRIAAGLSGWYERLMADVAGRLSLDQFFLRELVGGFTAYLTYLLLAGQGTLDLRAGTPLFVSSRDHEPPVDHARSLSFDVDCAQLLRDAEVMKLVASFLRGDQPW
jgi:hypothetical protein